MMRELRRRLFDRRDERVLTRTMQREFMQKYAKDCYNRIAIVYNWDKVRFKLTKVLNF